MRIKNIVDFEGFKKLSESGYPAGSANDPSAPWNQEDPDIITDYDPKGISKSGIDFSLIVSDLSEFALFLDKKKPSDLYIGYLEGMEDLDEFRPYTREYIGRDEDGDPEFETEYLEIDGEGLEAYSKSLLSREIGEGIDAWESGDFPIVKIDKELSEMLKDDFLKWSTDPKEYIKGYGAREKANVYKKMLDAIENVFPKD